MDSTVGATEVPTGPDNAGHWHRSSTTLRRRGLLFANLGQIRRRDTGDQDLQGECLTLLTNAIVCWNTVYTGAAIDHLSAHGHTVTDEQRRRLSPAGHQHVNFYGRYDFDLSAQPTDGHLRPLRT